nr:MAG: hypothetical protein 3 [Leviviridae sp.]
MEVSPTELSKTLASELKATNSFLTSDMSVLEARCLSAKESIVKKWIPDDTSVLDQIAIQSFLDSNSRCDAWQIPDGTEYVDDILLHARSLMARYLTEWDGCVVDLTTACCLGRHGPGASNGVQGETSFYHKAFDSSLTTTISSLYDHFVSCISDSWLIAERFKSSALAMEKVRVVEGSKLSTVPKNEKTSRTICSEPSLNMFYQLGVGAILERQLRRYHSIDLSTQPGINKAMACQGSIDGRFCTIDLKSASDSIASKFVQWFLPREAYAVCDLLRSKYTSYNGEKIEMKMFSSMGNGFTFPLQTLIFATLVRATYECQGIRPISSGAHRNYAVFGDDIIAVNSCYHVLAKVLTRCGFVVNDDKSFHNGHFRESCGGDFYRGENIRGVYIKKLSHVTHVYSSFNRLARWSAATGIPIANTLNLLKSTVKLQPVPFDESDEAGIKLPSIMLTNRKVDRNGALYYRATRPVSRKVKLRFARNPYGLCIAAIGGYVRSTGIPVRSNGISVQVIRCKTPSWDFIPHAGLTIRDYVRSLVLVDLG